MPGFHPGSRRQNSRVTWSPRVRIINDYSFDPSTARGEKGGLNRDTASEEVPPCLCGEALPALLNVLTDLRIWFLNRRILLAKADVTEAFRNVRVAPDQAQKICYMVDGTSLLCKTCQRLRPIVCR